MPVLTLTSPAAFTLVVAPGPGPRGATGAAAVVSTDTPQPLGVAGAGVSTEASASDHVHAHGDQAGGSLHSDVVPSGASGFMDGTRAAKLDGVSVGATANATDAQLRARATHTGTQAAGTITGLATVATSGADTDVSSSSTGWVGATVNAVLTAAKSAYAAVAAALSSHLADTANPHSVTAAQTGAVPTARALSTTAPLTGGGDLSADRTLAIPAATASAAGYMTTAYAAKLDGVATGATANSSDATLLARANHTGTQAAGTITGLAAVATSGAYTDLSGTPTLGTAAAHDVPASGDAASAEVVLGNDSRLTDARTPITHTHADTAVTSSGTGWIGATVNAALTAAKSAYDALSSALTAHTSDTNNPHSVTAAQVGAVPTGRILTTTAPLTGGGGLSSDRTLAMAAATAGVNGYMTSTYAAKLDGIAAGATANSPDATLLARANHTGTQAISTVVSLQATLDAKALATRAINTTAPLTGGGDLSADRALAISAASGSAAGSMSSADFTKLSGVAAGATANSSDATLLARANHTGTQAAGTITGLAAVATSGAYSDLSGTPTLGTAAAKDIPSSGDASSTQVVYGTDSRLTNSRNTTFASVNTALAAANAAIDVNAQNIQNVARLGLSTAAPTHALTLATGSAAAFYNTADQTTNYERLVMSWSSNVFTIQSEKGGTGTLRGLKLASSIGNSILLQNDASNVHTTQVSSGGVYCNVFTNTGSLTSTSAAQGFASFSGTVNQTSGTGSWDGLLINPTLTAVGSGGANLLRLQAGSVNKLRVTSAGLIVQDSTVTSAGTTGNQTINKPSGTVNIAAGGTSVTVTNSLVTATTNPYATLVTNDVTATGIKCITRTAGSMTITLTAAATAEVAIAWSVSNT